MMIRGLVLGKFYPLHTGHIDLIKFSLTYCDELIVWLCASDKENIPARLRLEWIKEAFHESKKIIPILFEYSESELPNSSVSSLDISKLWAQKINTELPVIDIIFSSERYGDYLSQFLNCRHIAYNLERDKDTISGTLIRQQPMQHWNEIAPAAKAYFLKKVCISGTESTGKSTLAKLLAKHYATNYVEEMARYLLEHTDVCTEKHLQQIAQLQAETIKEKIAGANRLLFIDTDINTTRSYSKYLFNKELKVPKWIEEANHSHLYLFLDNDAPYIQDGTRLDRERRDALNTYHKNELLAKGISFEVIQGSWSERFNRAVEIIDERFFR